MSFKKVRNYAVKVLALLSVTCLAAGIVGAGLKPNKVIADDNLYPTLYDMFKERSGNPDSFMSQEDLVKKVLSNCKELDGITYDYGSAEHYLGCDGFVSLVLRMTFGTVHEFERTRTKYWAKFDYHEEHKQAGSYVDKYGVYRPGGTTVTWLYEHYVNTEVKSLTSRKYVEGWGSSDWAEYLESVGAQPGDIMFWDNDNKNDCWSHIGIYAGNEDGVPKMWHASSIEEKVCKQSLSAITCDVQYLDYVLIVPMTDHPAKVGLFVDTEAENEYEFSYSVYKDPECTQYLGRISSLCTLSSQSPLENIKIYPNEDKKSFDLAVYVRRDQSPYSDSNTDQDVIKIKIRIDLDDDGIATLKYAIYMTADMRYYSGDEIYDYDYLNGGQVIPLADFR